MTARPDNTIPELLAIGSEPEETIRCRVVEELKSGTIPIGFVRFQSKHVRTKLSVETEAQRFPFTEHLEPWAGQMLKLAVEQVRCNWQPRQ